MILWHVGGTIAVVRYVFKDPAMDLRFLAFGAILPDLVDKPIGWAFFDTGRVFAHALVFPVAVLAVVMLATARGTTRRKAWLGLPIGSLLHLFLDLQFTDPEGFWWPFLGAEFPGQDAALGSRIVDSLTDPWVIAGEVVGLMYLVTLYRRGGLTDADQRDAFLRTGRIPLPVPR